jgi:two-component system, OmpR family, sensor histidine kinase VicK
MANEIERTEVLHGSEKVMNTVSQFLSKANSINSCGDYKAPSLVFEIEEYKKLMNSLKEKRIRLRYVTDITKDNFKYCKEMMEFADEVRHLDGLKANFSVSETEYLASASLSQQQKQQPTQQVQQVIYSNVKDIVEQQKYVFESFWNKAMPAEQRIREIEEGIEPEFYEVIVDRENATQILVDLAKSLKKEALFLLPNDKSIVRIDKIGIIDYLIKASQNEGTGAIMIICPISEVNSEIIKKVSENAPAIRIVNGNNSPYGMYIVDGHAFRAELKEPEADNFSEAIGFSVYSNRKNTVDFFKSVFELLWNERKLNEELIKTGKMQEEFINVASHELRTPTQAVLAYSQLVQKHPEKTEEMIQAIYRNAKRLQRLTNDILDVTKIESKTFKLNKTHFSLNDLLSSVVDEYKENIDKANINVRLLHNETDNEFFLIEADRQRITQVVSNLLDNAIKFTKGKGEDVEVIAKRESKKVDREIVVVNIKDTGSGIDTEILPKLFTKFVTKSETGTGLGLFICKSIVEAHGGKIWAENNTDGKGATFNFSLPLNKQSKQQGQQKQQEKFGDYQVS